MLIDAGTASGEDSIQQQAGCLGAAHADRVDYAANSARSGPQRGMALSIGRAFDLVDRGRDQVLCAGAIAPEDFATGRDRNGFGLVEDCFKQPVWPFGDWGMIHTVVTGGEPEDDVATLATRIDAFGNMGFGVVQAWGVPEPKVISADRVL